MSEPTRFQGANQVALVSHDMAKTVAFHEGVRERPLVKTLDPPGGQGQQCFFDCGAGGTILFFWFSDAPPTAPGVASMHPDDATFGSKTVHASMNHPAINVPLDTFDEYVSRPGGNGPSVKVIDHGDAPDHASAAPPPTARVRSMYIADANGIHLEFAAFTRPFGPADVAHDPVDARGDYVRQPVPA
jgi:hypothetical protein